MIYTPIHIAGHGRSGTTILGQLFEGVANCCVAYEQSAAILRLGHPGQGVSDPAALRQWTRRGEMRIVDKEPRHIVRLAEVCDITGGRGLHIVRDGRDVACSVVRANRKNGQSTEEWLRKRTNDQWDWALSPAESKELSKYPARVIIATFWARLEAFARSRHDSSITIVRYEDLVMHPMIVGRGIARFVGGIDPEELGRSAACLMTNNPHKHVAHASSALHDAVNRTQRIGRWEQEFNVDEFELLFELAGDAYAALGYGWEKV